MSSKWHSSCKNGLNLCRHALLKRNGAEQFRLYQWSCRRVCVCACTFQLQKQSRKRAYIISNPSVNKQILGEKMNSLNICCQKLRSVNLANGENIWMCLFDDLSEAPHLWLIEATGAQTSQPVDKTGSIRQWWCFMMPIRCSLHLSLSHKRRHSVMDWTGTWKARTRSLLGNGILVLGFNYFAAFCDATLWEWIPHADLKYNSFSSLPHLSDPL